MLCPHHQSLPVFAHLLFRCRTGRVVWPIAGVDVRVLEADLGEVQISLVEVVVVHIIRLNTEIVVRLVEIGAEGVPDVWIKARSTVELLCFEVVDNRTGRLKTEIIVSLVVAEVGGVQNIWLNTRVVVNKLVGVEVGGRVAHRVLLRVWRGG